MIMLKATPAAFGAALQRLVGGVPLESATRRCSSTSDVEALRFLGVDNHVPDATAAEIYVGHQEKTVSRVLPLSHDRVYLLSEGGNAASGLRGESSWPSLRREESGGFSRGEELDHFTEFFRDRPMLYLFSFSSKRPFPAFAGDSKLVCVLQPHRHVHRSLTVDRYRASLGVLLSFPAGAPSVNWYSSQEEDLATEFVVIPNSQKDWLCLEYPLKAFAAFLRQRNKSALFLALQIRGSPNTHNSAEVLMAFRPFDRPRRIRCRASTSQKDDAMFREPLEVSAALLRQRNTGNFWSDVAHFHDHPT